jgi:predicted nucleotidyltransferase
MHPAVAQHRDAIIALCRKHHVARLDVFGSATTEDFDPAPPPEGSDVDFLVDFSKPGREDPWAYIRLRQDLVELLGRRVDLVEPVGIRNDDYRRGIEATRELFYAAA